MKNFFLPLLIASAALTAPFSAHSATFGLIGLANVSQSITKSTSATTRSDGILSYGGGLLIEHTLGPVFSLETDAIYNIRKVSYGTAHSVSANLIQVPILFRLNFWQFSLGAGGYIGYGIGKATTDVSGVVSTPNYGDVYKAVDFGGVASLRFTLPGIKLFGDARYTYGLANLTKAGEAKLTFNDIQLLAGIRF